MKLFDTLLGKTKNTNGLKLMKDSSGDWVVKKGSSIMYIGPKEKCEAYMSMAV